MKPNGIRVIRRQHLTTTATLTARNQHYLTIPLHFPYKHEQKLGES